ncbi:hypothetical protein ALP58_102352 [Pseudomonas savastanoi]|uniref:Uncharacterized protein n=8 Tax=Pseudomonas syringae group TaxID=136849 RepID=A0A3M6B1G0_PSESS|nr:hypothetical protein AC519_1128 [Pseudomonas savastanoi]KPB53130.1 Unknown protein sequence [Pseudomonas amygdali pv. myricae]KPC57097.1 Unknown protein sequence [Pseudomonas amygdali pv. morsprunorum]KPW77306.1 hypothetical protein ALO78_102141 [Pseudomonas amygdali pv. ciccaronei]KPW91664.1 hypothetical protein ALO50_102804 [Pseudomonas syringae pv. cerasicola]KPX09858.1 hypothetical protein ALO74_102382 [Pseudomonas syringae pv. cunninghamiae]KPX17999.1 hypothetical protein ALO73_102571
MHNAFFLSIRNKSACVELAWRLLSTRQDHKKVAKKKQQSGRSIQKLRALSAV